MDKNKGILYFFLGEKRYLIIELDYYGKDFKIKKFKDYAVLNFIDKKDSSYISLNDTAINQLLLKAKVIGEISSVLEGRVDGFKKPQKQQEILNAIESSDINQYKPLLLIELL